MKNQKIIAQEPFAAYHSKNPVSEFDRIQRLAELTRGIVMPNLKDAIIEILKVKVHDFMSDNPLEEAKVWAERNLVNTYTSHIGQLEQFDYKISKSAIKKYLNSSATSKSDSILVHLSVLKVLPKVIDASIEVEIHADYTKVNGVRSVVNAVNKDVLIHRFYAAILFLGKLYRIKTTIYEYRDTQRGIKPYTFEVIKIELLDESNSSNMTASGPNSQGGLSTNATKILQNVEKSYDKGKFILDESNDIPIF